jgi:hypothetical protein
MPAATSHAIASAPMKRRKNRAMPRAQHERCHQEPAHSQELARAGAGNFSQCA